MKKKEKETNKADYSDFDTHRKKKRHAHGLKQGMKMKMHRGNSVYVLKRRLRFITNFFPSLESKQKFSFFLSFFVCPGCSSL